MLDVINNSEIIVCIGSGGVGKTTVSATIAFLAASQGQRVLVLTVDPSQRLKTTMGLADNVEKARVHHPEITGELTASVIDAKKTFDDFVYRLAGPSSVVEKILKNKLYIQLSTTLSGSQEFTSLEKLYSEKESGNYDLIVLDTPPAEHAMEFLQAPQKLAALFNDNIAKWFRTSESKNIFTQILKTGTTQVLKALESLTGSEFMSELSDFFLNIQSWQGQLEERVSATHRLLVKPTTQFVLVTSFEESKLSEAQSLAKEITKDGYKLSTVVINRSLPDFIKDGSLSDQTPPGLKKLYKTMSDYYQQKEQIFIKFSNLVKSEFQIVKLPQMENDISDIDGVARFSHILKGQ